METAVPEQQSGENDPEQGGGRNQEEARLPGPAGAEQPPSAGRPRYWFPLVFFGGLVTLARPLSAVAPAPSWTGIAPMGSPYSTVAQAMYLGDVADGGPTV